ncbi:unnamed protein product [Oppiella nova]|uniref:Uncharacterized protein n=1 Tax=Oppiella nova TaxID=334625 RepID=A0A7R9QX75_9ACAR|nr:unnamed protein product [Oppiella nova]CAG2178937.1 unnamed protein product [Oppiella nova]
MAYNGVVRERAPIPFRTPIATTTRVGNSSLTHSLPPVGTGMRAHCLSNACALTQYGRADSLPPINCVLRSQSIGPLIVTSYLAFTTNGCHIAYCMSPALTPQKSLLFIPFL